MSQLLLVKAITDKLRADTGAGSLVTLTGHTSSNLRIARDQPPVKALTPFLGVLIVDSPPLIGVDATHVQKARVLFKSYSVEELTVWKLCDRMGTLLHDITGNPNTGYYDFSNTDICTRQTRYAGRTEPTFDSKTEVWVGIVEADVIWVNVPCPP